MSGHELDVPDQRGVAELDLLVDGHVLVLDETLLREVLVAILLLRWFSGMTVSLVATQLRGNGFISSQLCRPFLPF